MLVLVSFGYSQTPTGELNARRVMKSPLIDLASVECNVFITCIAECAMVQGSSSGYDPIDT